MRQTAAFLLASIPSPEFAYVSGPIRTRAAQALTLEYARSLIAGSFGSGRKPNSVQQAALILEGYEYNGPLIAAENAHLIQNSHVSLSHQSLKDQVLQYLLDFGAEPSKTVLERHIYWQHELLKLLSDPYLYPEQGFELRLRYLLAQGMDINFYAYPKNADAMGMALAQLVVADAFDEIRLLLEYGLKMDTLVFQPKCSLSCSAVRVGKVNLIRFLVEQFGASPSRLLAETAYQGALSDSGIGAYEMLITLGANPDSVSDHSYHVLHNAISTGNTRLFRHIVRQMESGRLSPPNTKTFDGLNAFHLATKLLVNQGSLTFLNELLLHSAPWMGSIDDIDAHSDTCLMYLIRAYEPFMLPVIRRLVTLHQMNTHAPALEEVSDGSIASSVETPPVSSPTMSYLISAFRGLTRVMSGRRESQEECPSIAPTLGISAIHSPYLGVCKLGHTTLITLFMNHVSIVNEKDIHGYNCIAYLLDQPELTSSTFSAIQDLLIHGALVEWPLTFAPLLKSQPFLPTMTCIGSPSEVRSLMSAKAVERWDQLVIRLTQLARDAKREDVVVVLRPLLSKVDSKEEVLSAQDLLSPQGVNSPRPRLWW